ncbi:hypothetical protein CCC_00993 [Paramagnetospirillum magnetotacticum MS-1]|uniref:Formylmethanofuran dehydrogenase subunit E domain-containing protein n=1 Tax=Paramagnetospirillum magnetotacticum MS-1 TaxID=272627 RepID=A0A0C2U8V9_PARME|nr:hypothetical protein [Paramagnetospirillum magnetotacticum]KIL97932.1 hypothetical protein CCC_00993 [Paramagnetospirillum magnetotacticum MS-1]
MPFPAFFADAPAITLQDPLAGFLGAPYDGMITYRYEDAVRLAGHSCPTVAGAWLMTIKALRRLWPDSMPERGACLLLMDESQDDGVTGVMAAVAGLVTGAAGPGGFKGIAGRFGRKDLLRFEAGIGAELALRRVDTGAEALARYHPELVPADPEMRERLQRVLAGSRDGEDHARFAGLWQERVRRILVDFADLPGLVTIEMR